MTAYEHESRYSYPKTLYLFSVLCKKNYITFSLFVLTTLISVEGGRKQNIVGVLSVLLSLFC